MHIISAIDGVRELPSVTSFAVLTVCTATIGSPNCHKSVKFVIPLLKGCPIRKQGFEIWIEFLTSEGT